MSHDPVFDSAENQALLVVCVRKTIRNAAMACIIWGFINLLIGFNAIQVNILNVGLVGLAFLMLGTGIRALSRPSLQTLLGEAIVSLLLFGWNVSISLINLAVGDTENLNGPALILPAVAALIFFRQYIILGHLKEAIRSIHHATVKEASALCKLLFRSKLERSPDIAEASSKRCRLRLMTDSVFCAQKNLARAFQMSRDNFRQCISEVNKDRIRVVVRHPLGKLTYAFNKKNSDKIKGWLGKRATKSANAA
jgi:hypothetical protein